jgi:uncharacterized protein (DUF2252 family)
VTEDAAARAATRRRVPTVGQRRALGRAARERLPRDRVVTWDGSSRTHDPLETIQGQNAIRLADILPIRHTRMALSPWTFYRGAAAVMAADLGPQANSGLQVQLCGDAHLLNFGLWATPERNLWFDLRDFDETLPGPFEWDVARLVASVVVLARDTGVEATIAQRAVERSLYAYRTRMAHHARARQLDIWYDRVTVDDLIGVFKGAERERIATRIRKQAHRRTSRGAAAKLTTVVDGHLRITEDPPVRVHLGMDQQSLEEEVYTRYHDSLSEERRHLLDRFVHVDAVRQIVGVGSVGMRVFLVLLEGRDGEDPLFLQVKQAGPSVYEPYCGVSRHPNHGQRVVVGKRLLQSATDTFVGWTSVQGRDFYVRQFRDMKVIPDGSRIAPRLVEFASACGAVLARAHARTGDPVAIDAYIGKGRRFDEALGAFAVAYADQTAADHARFRAAVDDGTLPAAGDV